MGPNDEQLVNYGMDTTLSITKTKPSDLQSRETLSVDLEFNNQKKYTGGYSTCRNKLTTRYAIANNSSRTIKKFYVDHSASALHGGYVIQTEERCIKRVTGFARFEFSLKENETIEFDVVEEAVYTQRIPNSSSSLEVFIEKQTKNGLLNEEAIAVLKNKVAESQIRTCLNTIAGV